jgi:amino acid permease
MNWLKFILILLGVLLGAWAIFWVIGIVYAALWYLFILGVIGIGGYVGYKLLKPEAKPQIEGKTHASQIEMDIDRNEKLLEEMKRKYLEK